MITEETTKTPDTISPTPDTTPPTPSKDFKFDFEKFPTNAVLVTTIENNKDAYLKDPYKVNDDMKTKFIEHSKSQKTRVYTEMGKHYFPEDYKELSGISKEDEPAKYKAKLNEIKNKIKNDPATEEVFRKTMNQCNSQIAEDEVDYKTFLETDKYTAQTVRT